VRVEAQEPAQCRPQLDAAGQPGTLHPLRLKVEVEAFGPGQALPYRPGQAGRGADHVQPVDGQPQVTGGGGGQGVGSADCGVARERLDRQAVAGDAAGCRLPAGVAVVQAAEDVAEIELAEAQHAAELALAGVIVVAGEAGLVPVLADLAGARRATVDRDQRLVEAVHRRLDPEDEVLTERDLAPIVESLAHDLTAEGETAPDFEVAHLDPPRLGDQGGGVGGGLGVDAAFGGREAADGEERDREERWHGSAIIARSSVAGNPRTAAAAVNRGLSGG